MTRKDYAAIAKVLRDDARHLYTPRPGEPPWSYESATACERGAYDQWSTTVLAMARMLSDQSGYDLNGNRRFDMERFLSAAGFRGGV